MTLYRTALMSACAGMALAAAVGNGHAQVGHSVANPRLSEAEAAAISRNVIPMEKRLRQLPPAAMESTAPTEKTKPPVIIQGDPGPAKTHKSETPDLPTMTPENFGQNPFGTGTNQNTIYHYTDSLVDTEARDNYPYRTTGHFSFVASNNKSYRCTAAMISRSIALTAGHCVHQGGDTDPDGLARPRRQGWIKSGYFVPARNPGAQPSGPYGYATVNYMATTSGWFNVGNIVKGYDVALIVLNKRQPPLSAVEMGNVVGWLGWCLSNCLQNYWYLTQLGYPGNYYSGAYMTEGQHLEGRRSDNTDFYHGSGMQGGSSGGPHVANLGSLSDSTANKGLYTSRNVAFAATSWGYTSDTFKIQGASSTSGPGNLNNFKSVWNLACTQARLLHGAGSCALLP